jgi:hypothetical protein
MRRSSAAHRVADRLKALCGVEPEAEGGKIAKLGKASA